MNIPQSQADFRQLTSDLIKYMSVILLGMSFGIVSISYSPMIAAAGAAGFAAVSIGLYASSRRRRGTVAIAVATDAPKTKNDLLFYVFFFSFFLSITIPKSGRTISNVPITTANICILLTLTYWLLKVMLSKKMTFQLPLFKPIMVLMVYGFAALIIGVLHRNPYKALVLDFVAFIGFIPVYFLVCHAVRTRNQVKMVIVAIVISSALICIYGVLQQRLGFERVTIPGLTKQYDMAVYEGVGKWNIVEGGVQKVYSTFQNGNIFGNHLAMFIPMVGGIFLALPFSKKKVITLGVFLLTCYVLILTYSRGALVGTTSGVLALALIAKKIRLKAFIVIVIMFSLFFVFFQQYGDRPELVRYNFRRITVDPDRFSAGRIARTKQVLEGFYLLPMSSMMFGTGFGGGLRSKTGWYFDYVDNLYLTLLIKMGIVGVVILLVVLVQMFSQLLKLRATIPDVYWQGLVNGGIAGLFASLVHNMADTLWFFPPLSANFWFLAGITMASAMIGVRENGTASI